MHYRLCRTDLRCFLKFFILFYFCCRERVSLQFNSPKFVNGCVCVRLGEGTGGSGEVWMCCGCDSGRERVWGMVITSWSWGAGWLWGQRWPSSSGFCRRGSRDALRRGATQMLSGETEVRALWGSLWCRRAMGYWVDCLPQHETAWAVIRNRYYFDSIKWITDCVVFLVQGGILLVL